GTLDGSKSARVSAVDRGAYRVLSEKGEATAELAGRLTYMSDDPAELPCVGDWVIVRFYNEGGEAIIHQMLPRRTFLRRKTAGESVDLQMIAANIDIAFIVQSCHFDFNPRRLERYLVMAADGHVEPVVLLTKTDLVSVEELEEKIAALAALTTARILPLSNVSGDGFEAFHQALPTGKTCCLLGSSGVGKTTLINRLMGRETFATGGVSGTGEGTHTTTRRQLILLDQGSLLIDTPGMRELGIVGVGDGVDASFSELAQLASRCRYADCSHAHEPGCAVRAAIETGELSAERFASYLKLRKESDFHELSYLDKRKKDKAFSRMVKTAKKLKKH
ncbi:MAG: ribosome small subunit-dependent GTPase A, partial [Desulfuromonas sp.]